MVVNDYATRKKKLSHAVEYGLIFHGSRIGKYYCKNMKYRITKKMVSIKKRARGGGGSFPILFNSA